MPLIHIDKEQQLRMANILIQLYGDSELALIYMHDQSMSKIQMIEKMLDEIVHE